MDEVALSACKLDAKVWQCPIDACGRRVSRKQTLKNHLQYQHNVQAGNPPKRYKRYEEDDTVSLPRTTKWRNMHSQNGADGEAFSENVSVDIPPADLDELDDELVMEDTNYLHDLNDSVDEEESAGDNDELVMEDTNYLHDLNDSVDEEESAGDNSNQSECRQDEDPPLYVLQASNLYRSELTRDEHLLSVSAFATRHNLSDTALKDLLGLVQVHLPENNIAETNINSLKQSCGFDSTYLQYHVYCNNCQKLFNKDAEICNTPGCGKNKSESSKHYFITGNLSTQLKEILEREDMWTNISEFKSCSPDNVCDITSGHEYVKMKNSGGFLDNTSNITLSLFVDGIPLFKSSSTSLWPIYILINEIPPKERFQRKNMILWGIWQGIGKPQMNMFMKPLVVDLIDIYENGVNIMGQESLVVKAMLIIATMDLQARAYVVSMTQHNGQNGCLYCLEPGTVVQSGKGHCRAYLHSDEPAPERTKEMLQISAEAAREQKKKVDGLTGKSVLWYLPYFSMVDNIVIDYMHGTLLGVTKKLLELWFDKTHSTEPYNIASTVDEVDKDLKSIKPPYMIHRLPRAISNTSTNWKASELRNWLLFYALPCLLGRLPEVYIVHVSCLVEGIYLLLQEGITANDLQRADILLQAFVRNTQILYGERFMSLNVHNLSHTVHLVRSWGPLWAWSCFCFESFNGEIKKSIHGTGNVCKSIFWALQAQKRIQARAKQLPDENKAKLFMEGLHTTLEKSHAKLEAYQCKIVKPTAISNPFSEAVKEQLQAKVATCSECDFNSVSKVVRNGYLLYSKNCSKVKKQNSYTIRLQMNTPEQDEGLAIEVKEFIMLKQNRKVFALGRVANSAGSILPRRVPHLQKLEFQRSQHDSIIPVEHLGEPLMVVNTKAGVFAASLPNNIERD